MSQPASPIGVFVTPVTPLQQNCTTVWCTATNKAAVIDPGGSVDAVLGEVERRGLTLDQIWITHGHLDHAGGAAEMQEKSGVFMLDKQAQAIINGIATMRAQVSRVGRLKNMADATLGAWEASHSSSNRGLNLRASLNRNTSLYTQGLGRWRTSPKGAARCTAGPPLPRL